MQVKYVLVVIYCAVPLLLHRADTQELCVLEGVKNEKAYCLPSRINRTIDYVPRVSHPIINIKLDGQPLKQLPRNAFQNVTSQKELTAISLDGCQIQHVDSDAFLNLDNLKDLSLTVNRISRFETGTFRHTKQLQELKADYNKIDSLQTGLFHNLVHLKYVFFSHNNITCIEKDTFRNTPSLYSLYVMFNRLEYLSPLFTDNFINITRLNVRGNPWNCDCNLKEFYEETKVNKAIVFNVPKCENPPALRGREFTNLTSDDFKCDTQSILPTNGCRESVLKTTEPVRSIRELVSTITINEPGAIIKQSGTSIKELSTSNGPNGTTTVLVTTNIVLQLPKNMELWSNVHVTPVRVTRYQTRHPSTTEENAQPNGE